jgi:ketosteroid isomerase-like protein
MTHKHKEATLKEAVAFHLQTITNRNLEAFQKTVVQDGRLRVILPNGQLLKNFSEIITFHQNWFADPDWSMNVNIQQSIQTAAMGYVFCDVVYHDLDQEGQPYQLTYWLTLTFIHEEGRWLLIHDQNTKYE